MSDAAPHDGPAKRLAPVPAIACFAVATAVMLSGVWRAGITSAIAMGTRAPASDETTTDWRRLVAGDATLAAAVVARNAFTLTHAPARLFEAEFCAPAHSTLAFGESMITLGVLAIPGWLITGNPVATYNSAVFAAFVLAATAMYLLVADWTGSRVAGMVAGFSYAFGSERVAGITHLFVFDTTGLVLGLFFARRWLAFGRWRDAIGLALSGALQIGTSLYPIISSLLVGVPIAAWLVAAHGFKRVRVAQVAFVVAAVACAAWLFFTPYLEVRANTAALRRSVQYFAAWSWFLPRGEAGVTWTMALLALVALLAPRPASDAAAPAVFSRWPVVLGAFLAAWAAAGPTQPQSWLVPPNLYGALARVLPGLDAVRVPARIDSGYHLGVSLLAGIGAAYLLQRFRSRFVIASAAILSAVVLETLVFATGSAAVGPPITTLRVAPANEDVEFFADLARSGNAGPLLELPIGDRVREFAFQSPPRVLMSAYHHRRTSACYESFSPPGRTELRLDALALPAPDALARICALGFTTAVVHLATPRGQYAAEGFHRASQSPSGSVRYLMGNDSMVAFELCAASGRARENGNGDT